MPVGHFPWRWKYSMDQKVNIKLKTDKLFGVDIIYFRTFATSICIFMAFVVISFAVIYPKIQEYYEVGDKITGLKKQVTEIAIKEDYLSKVDQDKIRQNQQLIEQAIPDTKDLYFLLNVVGEITRKYGYLVESFVVSPGEVDINAGDGATVRTGGGAKTGVNKSPFTMTPLNVTLSGPRENYISLIKAFERAMPLMSVDKFSVDKGGEDGASLKLVVSTYTLIGGQSGSKDISLTDLKLSTKESDLLNTLSEENLFHIDLYLQYHFSVIKIYPNNFVF